MTNKSSLQLQKEFEQYRPIIEKTIQPVIEIDTVERQTTLFESKFEGKPYFPLTMEYPTGSDGKPLKLLAQINFQDVPHHLPHFPTEGILQFFIDGYDDILGMDFDNIKNQEGFRIIYHENVIQDETKLLQDFSFIELANEELYFPVEKEMALSFATAFEPLTIDDFRSNDIYKDILEQVEGQVELEDQFYDAFSGTGHKLGGYPFFTQEDPRAYGDHTDSTILLLQIDSIGDHIMWGDVGVGNFFITEDELKRKDFSNVLYTWDCH